MRLWFAKKLQEHLAVKHPDGSRGVVGSNIGVRAKEADGRDIALFSQGDGFDLVYGNSQGPYVVVQLSPETLLKLAWFVIWRWWFRGTWCGWKLSAWVWCTETQIEEAAAKQSAKLHKRAYYMRRQEDAREG